MPIALAPEVVRARAAPFHVQAHHLYGLVEASSENGIETCVRLHHILGDQETVAEPLGAIVLSLQIRTPKEVARVTWCASTDGKGPHARTALASGQAAQIQRSQSEMKTCVSPHVSHAGGAPGRGPVSGVRWTGAASGERDGESRGATPRLGNPRCGVIAHLAC